MYGAKTGICSGHCLITAESSQILEGAVGYLTIKIRHSPRGTGRAKTAGERRLRAAENEHEFTVTHRRVKSIRKGPLSPEGRENYPSQQGCGLTG